MTQGACLCGSVRFEIAPPFRWFAYCHCSMCRRQYGALFGAGIGVERNRFRWLAGGEAIVPYRATASFERPFCRHCGSKVPALSHLPDVMLVPAGLLDQGVDARPRAHIFVGSRSTLCSLGDSLKRFEAYPPGVDLPVIGERTGASGSSETTGACLCGFVAYEITAPLGALLHCHCSLCRRSRGGPHATTSFVPLAGFRWIRGAEAIDSFRMPPPRAYGTDFCRLCGSLVPTVNAEAELVVTQAGALDAPLPALPGAHVYVGSKASWDDISDGLPQFDAMPPTDELASHL